MKYQKTIQLSVLIIFLFLIFAFGFALLITPDQAFSENENRSLRTMPHFRWDSLFDGKYADQINEYFADQFSLRSFWVRQKARISRLLYAGENNGVLLNGEGFFAKRLFDIMQGDGSILSQTDMIDQKHLRRCFDGVERAANRLSVPLYVMPVGRNIDVLKDRFNYPTDSSDFLLAEIENELAPNVELIDTVNPLRARAANGEYVYYRTDHHWTTLGAYASYCEIMKSFGLQDKIVDISSFEREAVSESFLGTLWSKSGMCDTVPDTVELWHLTQDQEFEIQCDGKILDGFYNRSYIQGKDKYSVFLDGTHDVVTITAKESEAPRPVLLLLKDSFANSMASFLALHFDLVLLNLSSGRSDFTDVSAMVDQYNADRVLICYSIENMLTTDKLCRLR